MTVFFFPRLPKDAARQMLEECTGLPIDSLRDGSELVSSIAYWYPTAPVGQRVPTEFLAHFQAAMREVAARHGYPTLLRERNPERGRFDREAVEVILDLLPMMPAEAAQESVWSFLSLIVLPDVSLWRWPNTKQKDDYERILGYPRNVFRRLWWRAYVFGGGIDGPGSLLFEDEAVAILERPTIGGNVPLARIIARTHTERFTN